MQTAANRKISNYLQKIFIGRDHNDFGIDSGSEVRWHERDRNREFTYSRIDSWSSISLCLIVWGWVNIQIISPRESADIIGSHEGTASEICKSPGGRGIHSQAAGKTEMWILCWRENRADPLRPIAESKDAQRETRWPRQGIQHGEADIIRWAGTQISQSVSQRAWGGEESTHQTTWGQKPHLGQTGESPCKWYHVANPKRTQRKEVLRDSAQGETPQAQLLKEVSRREGSHAQGISIEHWWGLLEADVSNRVAKGRHSQTNSLQ